MLGGSTRLELDSNAPVGAGMTGDQVSVQLGKKYHVILAPEAAKNLYTCLGQIIPNIARLEVAKRETKQTTTALQTRKKEKNPDGKSTRKKQGRDESAQGLRARRGRKAHRE